jgi:DNA-binding NarL/FixJ family response regulator
MHVLEGLMNVTTPKIRRVVIVDDSRISQAILEAAFEGRTDFKVVGIAGDAATGVDLVRRLAPDLVTLDLCMPYIDGAKALEMMSDLTAVCKIIVSEQASHNIALSSRLEALGASWCLKKSELTDDPSAFFRKINQGCAGTEAANSVFAAVPLRQKTARHPGLQVKRAPLYFGYPVPVDEEARLITLQEKQLANAVRERQFDLITRHAAETTGFPVCLLTFIDRDTQWIKSSYGYEAERSARGDAFCNYTLATGTLFIVQNAVTDPRFSQNPVVIGEPGFRTYAGHPVVSEVGVRIGVLCLLDTKVKPVSTLASRQLAAIAEIVSSMIDNRAPLAA